MKKKKFILIFMSLFLLLSSTLFVFNKHEVYSFASKIATKAAQKSAKKSLLTVVENKAQHTIRDAAAKKVSKETAEKYVQKEGKTMFHPDNSKRVYYMEKMPLSKAKEDALTDAIEKNINKRITGGRKWKLWENVLDVFIDQKFWMSLPTMWTLTLSSDSQKEIDDLAFESLVSAGIAFPAAESIYDHYGRIDPELPLSTYKTAKDLPFRFEDKEEMPKAEGKVNTNNKIVKKPDKVSEGSAGSYYSQFLEVTLSNVYMNNHFLLMDAKETMWYPGFENLEIQMHSNYQNYTNLGFSYYPSNQELDIYYPPFQDTKKNLRVFKNGESINDKINSQSYSLVTFNNGFISENDMEKLHAIYLYFPPKNHENYRLEFKLGDDHFQILFDSYFVPETIDQNLVYTQQTWSARGKKKFNFDNQITVRQIDMSPLFHPTLPQPRLGDIPISHGDLQSPNGDELYLPSPNSIPLTTEDGSPVEWQTGPDGEPTIINPETGNPVQPEENPSPSPGPIPIEDLPPFREDSPVIEETPVEGETPPENPFVPNEPSNPSNPTTPPVVCKEWDNSKMHRNIDQFSTKFPFSIPWDVQRFFVAIFGDIGGEKPSFSLPPSLFGKGLKIEIPGVIDNWMPFLRGVLLITFDIGVIYAIRKWFGGAT